MDMGAKLCVSFLIIALSYCAGYLYTMRYDMRIRHLSDLLTDFKWIQTEINYSHSCLPDIFEKMQEKDTDVTGFLFQSAALSMKSNEDIDFQEIWEASVKMTFQKTVLLETDRKAISELGRYLGKTDLEEQKNAIGYLLDSLKQSIDSAETEKKKNTKLYRSIFTSSGIMVVILLF